MVLKIAVPDLISNSYFPAVAAVELGFLAQQGLDSTIELIFPVSKAYAALRDEAVDCVAGSAHSALAAFPEWHGVKLLCAQAQGMYWFLVMRSNLSPARGDISVVKGRKIGAAPWVDLGLKRLLVAAGIDERRDQVTIAPVPNTGEKRHQFRPNGGESIARRAHRWLLGQRNGDRRSGRKRSGENCSGCATRRRAKRVLQLYNGLHCCNGLPFGGTARGCWQDSRSDRYDTPSSDQGRQSCGKSRSQHISTK
jgi:hypothetical protein